MPPVSDNSHSSTSAWDQEHWHEGSLRPITNSTCPCTPVWQRVHHVRSSKLVGKYRGFYALCSTTFVISGQGSRKNCSSTRQPADWHLSTNRLWEKERTRWLARSRKWESTNPCLNCLGWLRSREVDGNTHRYSLKVQSSKFTTYPQSYVVKNSQGRGGQTLLTWLAWLL